MAALVVAAGASATEPPPPGDDAVLGIYTTAEFGPDTENHVMAGVGETVTLHFILSYAPWPFLGGVEFSLVTDPPGAFGSLLLLGDTELPYGGLQVTPAPDYVVGYGQPNYSPTGHHYVLSQDVTVLAESPVLLRLQPYQDPTIPGEMACAYWLNPQELDVMVPYSEGYSHDEPVFGVNTEIVATEATSWSQVKALFE